MSSKLPVCPYGTRCYRLNPVHFQSFNHPHLPNNRPAAWGPASAATAPAACTGTNTGGKKRKARAQKQLLQQRQVQQVQTVTQKKKKTPTVKKKKKPKPARDGPAKKAMTAAAAPATAAVAAANSSQSKQGKASRDASPSVRCVRVSDFRLRRAPHAGLFVCLSGASWIQATSCRACILLHIRDIVEAPANSGACHTAGSNRSTRRCRQRFQ